MIHIQFEMPLHEALLVVLDKHPDPKHGNLTRQERATLAALLLAQIEQNYAHVPGALAAAKNCFREEFPDYPNLCGL